MLCKQPRMRSVNWNSNQLNFQIRQRKQLQKIHQLNQGKRRISSHEMFYSQTWLFESG